MAYNQRSRARALLGSAASTLVLTALLQAGMTTDAAAQDKKPKAGATAAAANEEGTEVEQVVVTGTFLRGTPATAVIPVEGVNLEELRDRGSPSSLDFVKGLSEVGSIVGEANRANAYAIGAQTVNLRGLGAARTVVVFNGRRFPETFSFTQGRFNNIAQIPTQAIGRVEVLKDGGATTYGADAVGGVVNYITRRNIDGVEVSGNYRYIKDSNGDYDGSIVAGKVQDKWNVLGVLGYERRSTLDLTDRSWATRPYLLNPTAWSFSGNPGAFSLQIPVGAGATMTSITPTGAAANNVQYTGDLQIGPTGVLRDPGCLALGGYNGFSTTPSPVCYTRTTNTTHLVEDQRTWHGYAEANYEFSPRFKVHGEFMYYGLDIPNIPIDTIGRTVAVFPLARTNDTPTGALLTNPNGSFTGAIQSVPNLVGTLQAYYVSGLNPAVQYMIENQLKSSNGTNAIGQSQILALEGRCIPVAPATTCTAPTPGRAALVTGSWNPWGLGGNPVPELDLQHNYSKQYRYTVEFSGDIGKVFGGTWDWSFAYTTNTMNYFYRAHDMLVDRLQAALNGFGGASCNGIRANLAGSTCQFFNPFSSAYQTNKFTGQANPFFVGTGTFPGYAAGKGLQNSPDLINWMYVPVEQDRQGQFDIYDLVIRGDLDYHLWSKDPIQMAFGAQYREFNETNDVSDFADERENPCATVGATVCTTANSPLVFRRGANLFGFVTDITRRKPVESAFAEVKVPITETINAQISTRYEKFFSDVGAQDVDVIVSQGAASWQARPWLKFRATAGQSFANADAPGPADPNVTATNTLGSGLGGTSNYSSRGYSNTNLRPERGFNYNLGVIFQVGDVTATVDYYDIKINGVLRSQTAAQILQALALPGTSGATTLVQCNSPLLTQINPLFADAAAPGGRPFVESSNPCTSTTLFKDFIAGGNVNFYSQQGQNTRVVNGGDQETAGVDLSVTWRRGNILGGDVSVNGDLTYITKFKVGPYTINGITVANGFDDGIGSVNLGTLHGANGSRIAQYRGSVTLNYRHGPHNFNWRTSVVSSETNDIDTLFNSSLTATNGGNNANIPNAGASTVNGGNNLTCTPLIVPPIPANAGTGIYGTPGINGAYGFDPCQNVFILSAMKIPATFENDFTYRLSLPQNLSLSLQVANVFDTDPRFSRDALSYDAGSGGGPLGRTFKFGVTKKW